jgi:hypothetical protein
MVVVRVGEQVLRQKMIDIPKTCEPKSGWNSAKMRHFIAKHNETARFLVHVGFMEGLSADEKARRGQAISDGLHLRPAEEKAAAAAAISEAWNRLTAEEQAARGEAMSAWHAGLSAAEKKARAMKTRSENAAIERKRAATCRENGTKRGPKKGGKVSERAPRC